MITVLEKLWPIVAWWPQSSWIFSPDNKVIRSEVVKCFFIGSSLQNAVVRFGVFLHNDLRRAGFEGMRRGVVEAPGVAGLKFLVRGMEPFVFQDGQLPGAYDFFSEKQSHHLKGL